MTHNTVELDLPNTVGHYAVALYRIQELLVSSKRLTDMDKELLSQLYKSLSNASYDAHRQGVSYSSYKKFSANGYSK